MTYIKVSILVLLSIIFYCNDLFIYFFKVLSLHFAEKKKNKKKIRNHGKMKEKKKRRKKKGRKKKIKEGREKKKQTINY